MPELPEVETTLRGLEPHFAGKQIIQSELRRYDLRWPVPENLLQMLIGARIARMYRRSKYILLELSNGLTVILHLGMSGSFRVEAERPEKLKKHDHFLMQSESGKWAIFHDPRRFGAILLSETAEIESHRLLTVLGPEPLDSDAFSGAYLQSALKGRKIAIKNAIMMAKIVVGVGNIYASEALYLAGIHPLRASSSLSRKECEALVAAIRTVLSAAIQSGGSTLKDYLQTSGQTGYFQHHFRVYDRAGLNCEKCKAEIVRQVINGRSSYFCSFCQR